MNDVTTLAATDAFDCGAMVWVGNTVVADDDGTVDVSPSGGDTVVTPSTQTIGGLQVTDTYRMFAAGDTMRLLVKLTNPTAAPISTPVTYVSNFGSDATTTLAGSSSGGASFTTADRWIVTADHAPNSSDVINTSVFSGPGAVDATPTSVSSTVFSSSTTDGALATFDVTVPAGLDPVPDVLPGRQRGQQRDAELDCGCVRRGCGTRRSPPDRHCSRASRPRTRA